MEYPSLNNLSRPARRSFYCTTTEGKKEGKREARKGRKEGSCRLAKTKTDSSSDPRAAAGFMQGREGREGGRRIKMWQKKQV